MNKKGFTLIELLAVIVILAIIALIVTPMISNVIANAKKASASRSVEGTVTAIEYAKQVSILDMSALNSDYKLDEEYNVDISTIDFKAGGNKPTAGYVNIVKGKVISGVFCIDNYLVEYTRGTTKILSEDGCNVKIKYITYDTFDPNGPFVVMGSEEYNPLWGRYGKDKYLGTGIASNEICINSNGKDVCVNINNRIYKDTFIKDSNNGIFETSLCSDLTSEQKQALSVSGTYSVEGFNCIYGSDKFTYAYKQRITSDNEHFTPKRVVYMKASRTYASSKNIYDVYISNETVYYNDSDFREDMIKYLEMTENEFNGLPEAEREIVGDYFNIDGVLRNGTREDGTETTYGAIFVEKLNAGRLRGYAPDMKYTYDTYPRN